MLTNTQLVLHGKTHHGAPLDSFSYTFLECMEQVEEIKGLCRKKNKDPNGEERNRIVIALVREAIYEGVYIENKT